MRRGSEGNEEAETCRPAPVNRGCGGGSEIVTAWAYEALGAELLSALVLGVLVVRSWRVVQAHAPQRGRGRGVSGGRDAHHGRVEVTAPH